MMYMCPANKCFSNHEPILCAHTGGSRTGGDGILVELPELEWSAEEKRSRDVREMWGNYHERRHREKRQDSERELIRNFARPPYFNDDGIGGGITRLIHAASDLPPNLTHLPVWLADRLWKERQ